MIYLSAAIGLTPGGSGTIHIYTQTVHRTTQITTNLEECGPCPVFASFTLAFALQLRKKHGKPSVRSVIVRSQDTRTALRINIIKEKSVSGWTSVGKRLGNKSWRDINAGCDFRVCIRHVSFFPASGVTKFRRCL